jgi:hypothetical protein
LFPTFDQDFGGEKYYKEIKYNMGMYYG